MSDTQHVCKFCGNVIAPIEAWEYYKPYPVGTPEAMKERVHSYCVARLVRDTLKLMAKVSEDRRGE